MTRTYVIAPAFLALALSACAGTAASPSSAAPHYLGGRAGQPGGSAPTSVAQADSPNERSPVAASSGGSSYLGGRMAQPDGWLPPSSSTSAPGEAANAYAYQGGRAGQPWSGPSRQ